ncbi:hypothetical protein [Burkholderia multivorans]|uniref:hypothetical protein n=1 Tax=Burkholderia multivorans TaxID=87883 RepID=UPI000F5035CC|nr:hypothetical protein [Burkholderia multivorans]MBU9469215.1 hypothetical protein [Burkholderia multivorans]MCA8130306.1 hypothetical protein [Burkholderia multivorans]MCA8441159.1 hypothetical protein [Burkholderia multivorans]QIX16443.1 hypothetical protein FOB32_12305 [Burkholderia multivorans]
MQIADSIFREIRTILGARASVVDQAATPAASISSGDTEVATWILALQGADLTIPWSAEELHLYGSQATLEAGQIGYRVDALGGRLSSWKEEWLVLGQVSGDPIIGEFNQKDCNIIFARHGSGSWRANHLSNDITSFAEVLHIWCDLFVAKYARNVYDDTLALRPDFLAELRHRVSQKLSNAQTDVFMSMVDG